MFRRPFFYCVDYFIEPVGIRTKNVGSPIETVAAFVSQALQYGFPKITESKSTAYSTHSHVRAITVGEWRHNMRDARASHLYIADVRV